MVKLTNEEEHWLREFAKESEFFESILTSYEVNLYLTSKQRHRIREEIKKDENDGDIILTNEELIFLIEFVDIDSDLEELMEIYEIYECFSEYEYRKFINLKLKYIEKEKQIDYKEIKRNIMQERKKVQITKKHNRVNNDPKRLSM